MQRHNRIVPMMDRVLVRKLKPQSKVGGIMLPETAVKKTNQGEVLATGPGARDKEGKLIPLSVKAGDKVLLSEYGGSDFELDGEELTIYREDDILGIVKDDK